MEITPINRRLFIKNSALAGLARIVSANLPAYSHPEYAGKPQNFMIGIDNSGDKYKPGEFFNKEAMKLLGVDFVVYHYRTPKGSIEDEVSKMIKLGNDFQEANLKVIVNVECGNWNKSIKTTDGHEWVTQPGDLQLFKFPPSVLKALNSSDAVWGDSI